MTLLFLSPHPDDVELTCGGTIAYLTRAGHEVYIAVFSDCGINLNEMSKAHQILGAKTIYYNYPRREFNEYRQHILDTLIALKSQVSPHRVFLPDQSDIHQDHQVIGIEGSRAFRMTSDIISFAHTHNHMGMLFNYYYRISQEHIDLKLKALKCYNSQQSRKYFSEESIISVMRYYGLQCGSEFAEAYKILKIIT